MLSRGWMSFKDRDAKADLLGVAWVLPAAKAIPRPGWKAKITDAASQMKMGLMLGQDRSTTNRHLRKFCGDDAKVVRLFNKRRAGVGVVNRYSEYTDQAEPEPTKKQVLLTHDPEKLADRFGADFFDGEAQGLSGSGPVELWTFSEEILEPIRCSCRLGQMKFNFNSLCLKCGGKGHTFEPGRKMGPTARIVLTALQLKGIKHGYVELSSEALGKMCGLCENTVAHCLDQWEDLKVLQIVPGQVFREPGTNAVIARKPQRIIWLPGLLVDHDVVAEEKKRFEEAARTVFLTFGLTPSLAMAKQRHAELLAMWQLSRKSVGSFWSYLHRRLIRYERCDRKEVDMLFPLHRAWNDS